MSQNVLFHGIKILERRKKNATGNVEQIILPFQPGYRRKRKNFKGKMKGSSIFVIFWENEYILLQFNFIGSAFSIWNSLRMFCTGPKPKFLFKWIDCFKLHLNNELWSFFLLWLHPLVLLLELTEGVVSSVVVCSSRALTAVSNGTIIYSKSLVLRKTG